jgi:uncharacterized protein DUF3850
LIPRKIHDLKTHPIPFLAQFQDAKQFEYRRDDRDFDVGDVLILREWDPETSTYTGAVLFRGVTYKLKGGHFGVPGGYCVLGTRPIRVVDASAGGDA